MPAFTPASTLFAKNLKTHRSRLGVSQEALSRAAGLGRNTVGNIEKRQPSVYLDTINRLAIALDVDPCVLLSTESDGHSGASYVERGLDQCVVRNLKALRATLGLSQEDVALRAGFPRTYIYKIESNGVSVTLDTLDAVAASLDIHAWQLLT